MSIVPIGTTVALAAARGLLNQFFVRPRAIGPLIADVTVMEQGLDELAITEHPVETGAAITDHAYRRPAQVTIRVGFSNSSPRALGNLNYIDFMYQAFLSLQESRTPFSVITGKRIYSNMLISRLFQTTDERTENVLDLIVECREVILVSTQTVVVPPAASMKTPQANAATLNTGTKALKPGSNYNFAPDNI